MYTHKVYQAHTGLFCGRSHIRLEFISVLALSLVLSVAMQLLKVNACTVYRFVFLQH